MQERNKWSNLLQEFETFYSQFVPLVPFSVPEEALSGRAWGPTTQNENSDRATMDPDGHTVEA